MDSTVNLHEFPGVGLAAEGQEAKESWREREIQESGRHEKKAGKSKLV